MPMIFGPACTLQHAQVHTQQTFLQVDVAGNAQGSAQHVIYEGKSKQAAGAGVLSSSFHHSNSTICLDLNIRSPPGSPGYTRTQASALTFFSSTFTREIRIGGTCGTGLVDLSSLPCLFSCLSISISFAFCNTLKGLRSTMWTTHTITLSFMLCTSRPTTGSCLLSAS